MHKMNLYQITDLTGQVVHVAAESMAGAIELFAKHSTLVEPHAIEKLGTVIMPPRDKATFEMDRQAKEAIAEVLERMPQPAEVATYEQMKPRMAELSRTAEGLIELENWAFRAYKAGVISEKSHKEIQGRIDAKRGVVVKAETDEVIG
jgi:hypothetical protein